MKTGGADNGSETGGAGLSAAARVRASGEDFSASFLELRETVERSCRGRSAWEEKVVAGILAVAEFAAAQPGKALALTVNARRSSFGERNPEQVLLAYFTDLLAGVAPRRKLIPVSTDESVVESIAAVVRGHLLGGTAARLPAVAPDLVYLALMPYLGLEQTRHWAETAVPARK